MCDPREICYILQSLKNHIINILYVPPFQSTIKVEVSKVRTLPRLIFAENCPAR